MAALCNKAQATQGVTHKRTGHHHSVLRMTCSLLAGKSGVEAIDRFDASEFPTKFAAQIKNFSADGYVLFAPCSLSVTPFRHPS
jgi:3-oxoacyl-(acyl-carrier-protein) synthase